jgi:hypothetical protein
MTQKEKGVAVADFKGIKFEAAGIKVLALLNVLLEDTRVENDTASHEQVLRNQGKIDLIIQLIRYLVHERPEPGQ